MLVRIVAEKQSATSRPCVFDVGSGFHIGVALHYGPTEDVLEDPSSS